MTAASANQPADKNERLLEVSRQLNKFTELEPMLQFVVDIACELTLSEAGSISLLEEETGLLKFVAGPPSQRDQLKRLRVPLDQSVAGQAFSQARPVVVQDARQVSLVYREVDQSLGFETRSILAVPVIFRDKTIGVLETVNKRGETHYTEEDVTILETLASQASIAIFTSLLLEETEFAYRNLDELERMKSDFVAIASHELRTPLGLILGHATFLNDSSSGEEQKRQLDVIIRSAMRLKKIVDDLANLDSLQDRKSLLRTAPLDLAPLIREVAASFSQAARRKQIAFSLDFRQPELILDGDAEKIGVVLNNLIKNALTYTDPKGHVKVSAERLGGYVRVSVMDDGIGIPAKDLQRVFERFFQVESHYTRRHEGLGLGLSVAKVMVELHGGQIWVESVEGKGSNFSFLLPAGRGQERAEKLPFQS